MRQHSNTPPHSHATAANSLNGPEPAKARLPGDSNRLPVAPDNCRAADPELRKTCRAAWRLDRVVYSSRNAESLSRGATAGGEIPPNPDEICRRQNGPASAGFHVPVGRHRHDHEYGYSEVLIAEGAIAVRRHQEVAKPDPQVVLPCRTNSSLAAKKRQDLPLHPEGEILHVVAPRLQCANHSRRGPQGPLTRAVFLLGAGHAGGPGSPAEASVRVVGRQAGTEPNQPILVPRLRLG